MRYILVAGEASGDEHGARLISALLHIDSAATFVLIGGSKMAQAAGVEPLVHYRHLAVMGLVGIAKQWRSIQRAANLLDSALQEFRPDLVIPIDYGGFNLRYTLPLASQYNIPIIYYIPPKVWASRQGRIRLLREKVVKCLTILPFEANYLQMHGIEAHYVGNPSVQSVGTYYAGYDSSMIESCEPRIIALLPGSRTAEIKRNLPAMCRAIDLLPERYHAVIAQAPSIPLSLYQPYLSERIRITSDGTFPLLVQAAAAVVTSGTANLETALIGTPQVVCYGLPLWGLARWTLDHILPINHISLSNILLRRTVVTELIGGEVRADRIRCALTPLLARDGTYEMQQCDYAEIRQLLGTDEASSEAARCIINYLSAL